MSFPVYHLSGTVSDLGKQYGKQASSEISSSMLAYEQIFEHNGMSFEQCCEEARKQYLPTLLKCDPGAVAEMRAMGHDFDKILALNCRTELIRRANLKKGSTSECTTVFGDGLLAQTWDWQMLQKDNCCIVQRTHSKGSYVTLTEGGILCKQGMNNFGLSVVLNFLSSKVVICLSLSLFETFLFGLGLGFVFFFFLFECGF